MSFIAPPMLLLLLLIPLLVYFYWRIQQQRQRLSSRYGTLGIVQGATGFGLRRHIPFVFFLLAFLCMGIALARPEMMLTLPRIQGTVMLTFDVSGSMAADDFDPTRMDMALLCVDMDRTTGHNGKRDFNLSADGKLARYRDGDPNPVVYAGAIAMDSCLLDDAPADAFNLNIYFDRAIEKSRLFGLSLDGHWITVGTPDAIEDAEDIIRQFREKRSA